MPDPRSIGVFDSGLGGLTVLQELARALPGEDFLYFGDTARVPYGAKSARTVRRYSEEVAQYLLERDVKMLVIACNTATAHAESLLRDSLPVPVVGVIDPGVTALLASTQNRRVGVAATRSTIKSGEYTRRIQARDPALQVFPRACPLFVPLVEEGWIEKKATRLIIQEYFSELEREEVDATVLGCTHYPLLKNAIAAEFPRMQLIDSSEETARAVRRLLEKQPELARDSGAERARGVIRIHLTDLTQQMNDLENFLSGLPVDSVEEVQLPQ